MVLWFASLSIAGVFFVFRDPAMDYRLVAAGALLPDLADGLFRRGIGPAHSVTVATAALVVVMLASIGRRSVRRRLLAVNIGVFAHLVLDGAWLRTKAFWWPIAGRSVGGSLPAIERGWKIDLAMELIGVIAAVYLWRRFHLDHPKRRALFVKQGRIDRRLI
jgi:hypothetical protein